MSRLLSLYRSTLGKKAIVAVTGVAMLVFLVLHVIGNLKAFLPDPQLGVPDIDVYSRYLRSMGTPLLPHGAALWAIRIVMLVALALHVVCVVKLARINHAARPIRYHRRRFVEATTAARSMLVTGAILLAFLGFHLLQFTTGTIDSERFVEGAVYANLYRAFHEVSIFAIGYVLAMGILATHVYHGAWSLFQSLGYDRPDRNPGLRAFALLLALGLFVTFSSVPVAFFSGKMPVPPDSKRVAAVKGGG
ncbi:succinate dehydrogenase cytochrome b subunit [Myxococcota bacterium]|nr:succinate dehydrogenase cytochrome b subunit [Myxococcota bacterium]